MLGGDAEEGCSYSVWMPEEKAWSGLYPSDVLRVHSPGYVIMKHDELEEKDCVGLENIRKVLTLMFKSREYGTGIAEI